MVQTVTSRSLIIHNDFALGVGLVQQVRGLTTFMAQMVEIVFIFRTLDEIRYLDITRYTRVALHTAGPLIEYYYDNVATGVDDGDELLAPLPAVSVGRWRKIIATPPSYDTTSLADIAHAVNVSSTKKAGYMVWNNSLLKPVWAVDTGGAAIWVDANGTTVHTPS